MILHKASKTLIKLIQGIEQLIRIMTTFAHFSPLDKSLDERGFRIEYQLEPFYRKVSDLIDFILFISGHITIVLVVVWVTRQLSVSFTCRSIGPIYETPA